MDVDERTRLISEAVAAAIASDHKTRLWVLGEWRSVPVARVPVAALVLNIDNRRFAAERRLFESKLGHSFDPENSDVDTLSVEAILLDRDLDVDGDRVAGKPGKDYQALRQDWQRRKQESPFWIRPDGTVRNGNRRLAMLRRLTREEGAGGDEYVDAVVLDPAELNELAVFEMEQREQLTEDYKLRYTDINLLLAIKDAADDKEIDWYDETSLLEVAGALQHVMRNDRGYAIVQLYAIKYMKAYLEDLGQDEQYEELIGTIERFRDVGRIMRFVEADDPSETPAMLDLLFAAVSAGLTHLQIRPLRNIYIRDRNEFHRLVQAVHDAEGEWVRPSGEDSLVPPSMIDEEPPDPESYGEPPEPPGPVVANYPSDSVRAEFLNSIDRHGAAQASDMLQVVKEVNNRLAAMVDGEPTPLRQALDGSVEALRDAVDHMMSWFDEHGAGLR